MGVEDREYVVAPWGDEETTTEIVTVDLPSRELTVQLEVPVDVLERTAEQSEEYGLPVEIVLAERLEINRARVAVLAARAESDINAVQAHLRAARGFLEGVEELEGQAADVRSEIESVWLEALESE